MNKLLTDITSYSDYKKILEICGNFFVDTNVCEWIYAFIVPWFECKCENVDCFMVKIGETTSKMLGKRFDNYKNLYSKIFGKKFSKKKAMKSPRFSEISKVVPLVFIIPKIAGKYDEETRYNWGNPIHPDWWYDTLSAMKLAKYYVENLKDGNIKDGCSPTEYILCKKAKVNDLQRKFRSIIDLESKNLMI